MYHEFRKRGTSRQLAELRRNIPILPVMTSHPRVEKRDWQHVLAKAVPDGIESG
jgi:hypothetical protein